MNPKYRRVLGVCVVLTVVLVACDASSVTGLPRAKVGQRCTGTKIARDSRNVLVCKKGRWVVSMSIAKALAGVNAYNAFLASQTTTTAAPTTAAPTTAAPTTAPPTTAPPTTAPPTTAPPALTVSALGAGNSHTCALRSDGTVVCFGDNQFGQLGTTTNIGDGSPIFGPNPVAGVSTPAAVVGLTGVTALAVGGRHTCALVSGGTVACFGYNYFGQLGATANGLTPNPTPTTVPGLTGVTAISAGAHHTCALKSDQSVVCFGYNNRGQLGGATNNGTTNPNPTPSVVAGLSGVVAISAGYEHSCVVKSDQTVACFGYNEQGQLGDPSTAGSFDPHPTPIVVAGLSGITAITTGINDTCARRNDGTVSCFGVNGLGQLGTATNSGSSAANPTPIVVSGLADVDAVAAGDAHTCVVNGDGTVACFGTNGFGQLGNATNTGTSTPNTSPSTIAGLSGAASVASGSVHTCVLRGDGTVVCFGGNTRGQLGTSSNSGSSSPNSSPILVAGLT